MNKWTQKSVDLATSGDYLDKLFDVYTILDNPPRPLSKSVEQELLISFHKHDDEALLRRLLSLDLFPIKDSYIPYLKKSSNAIENNPDTVTRITKKIYELGYDEVIERCTAPKETNRQMGPMFKNWIDKKRLGYPVLSSMDEFANSKYDCIYNASDKEMKDFAKLYLGFNREKGIDFLAKIKGKYIIAEAKFLSDFGGHQDAQFDDAIHTMHEDFSGKIVNSEVIPISIMDGVLYIKGNNKMHKYLVEHPDDIIMSALVLDEFLRSI